MGIKQFFSWMRREFYTRITSIKNIETLKKYSIDNLLIDANGIFHECAQSAFHYGEGKSLLAQNIEEKYEDQEENCFAYICERIGEIVKSVKPKKRIIICIDGPAPVSKQKQQRQRRFASLLEKQKTDRKFDSNCITPGTVFMDKLSERVKSFIFEKMTLDSLWKKLDVIFSDEKVPGEGEHKLIKYVRLYGHLEDSYCIYGMDADLIMLSLSTHYPKFYVLRPDNYSKHEDMIDIGGLRTDLVKVMKWESPKKVFSEKFCINDFVFLCFLVGNDFLPCLNGLDIMSGGIEFLFASYRTTGSAFGHITLEKDSDISFRRKALEFFISTIAEKEKELLITKYKKIKSGELFPDKLMERFFEKKEYDSFKKRFYKTKFSETDVKKIGKSYLEGLLWVLKYYRFGIKSWDWYYPYHYPPFAKELQNAISEFEYTPFVLGTPILPFTQLVSVLPSDSFHLLPSKFYSITEKDEMKEFFPKNVEIDISGKKKLWEATVLIPHINREKVELFLKDIKISKKDSHRNRFGETFFFMFDKELDPYTYKDSRITLHTQVRKEILSLD